MAVTSISWKFKKKEQEESSALSDTTEKFNRMRIFKKPSDLTFGRLAMTSRRPISVDVGRAKPHHGLVGK